MRGPLFGVLCPVLAWSGFVSCDDPKQIEGLVRTVIREPSTAIHCREPQVWNSESDWLCVAELRGERSCYAVRDLDEVPHQVTCPSGPRHRATVEIP